MASINLVFRLVNNLKYYLEINGLMVFPEKHQAKYCIFQIDSPLTSNLFFLKSMSTLSFHHIFTIMQAG